jgi:hypothetical protein
MDVPLDNVVFSNVPAVENDANVNADGDANADDTQSLIEEKDYKLEHKKDKFNSYATNKSISQNLLNITVIQYNIGLFIYVFYGAASDTDLTSWELGLVILLAVSLSLEITMFVFLSLLIMVRQDYKPNIIYQCCGYSKRNTQTLLLLYYPEWH